MNKRQSRQSTLMELSIRQPSARVLRERRPSRKLVMRGPSLKM
jgi:hypothetical protein